MTATTTRETATVYAFPLNARLKAVANDRAEAMAKAAQLCGTVATDAWYHQEAMNEVKPKR